MQKAASLRILRRREARFEQRRHHLQRRASFPKVLYEMGQQNEKFAHASHARGSKHFCDAKICRAAKRLECDADFLRCNFVDTAMHNQGRGQDSRRESIIRSNRRIVTFRSGTCGRADTLILCADRSLKTKGESLDSPGTWIRLTASSQDDCPATEDRDNGRRLTCVVCAFSGTSEDR